MSKLGRPTSRQVAREEAQAVMAPVMANVERILAILSASGPANPLHSTPTEAPKLSPVKASRKAPTAKVAVDSKGTERPPEGGYANTFEFIASNAMGEPRIKLGSYVVPEEILAQNVNIYFWNETTGRSVKPIPQVREALVEAGFRFSTRLGDKAKGGPARWYGDRRTLPSMFEGGEVKVRTLK